MTVTGFLHFAFQNLQSFRTEKCGIQEYEGHELQSVEIKPVLYINKKYFFTRLVSSLSENNAACSEQA